MQIYINKYHKDNVLEKFLDKEFEVYSRSGLNETERRLINKLPELKNPKRILILENRTGVLGMIARKLYPQAEIILQNTDRYYCDKVEHNFKHNNCSLKVICEADIPEKDFDIILWQQSRNNLIKEYVFDLMQQCHKSLCYKGKLFLALEVREKLITERMQDLFGGATIDEENEKGLILIGKKKKNPVEYIDYSDEITYKGNYENPVKLISIPGVFAHHRIDKGAQALLDKIEIESGQVLMDMGCGLGSIGITLQNNFQLKKVYFVDSSARAIKATEMNCRKNNLKNSVLVLSSGGYTTEEKLHVFAGNPPYYSDFRIAGLFVNTAWKNLRRNGSCWFVTRNPWKLAEIIKDKFGNCREIRHHGYSILTAEKK